MRYAMALEWSCNLKVTIMVQPPDQSADASLLFRWMDMLQVDRSDLARDNPPLFHELQGVCASCRSKEECAQDLANEFDHVLWIKWWSYCPNSAVLRDLWRDAIIGRVEVQVPLRFS